MTREEITKILSYYDLGRCLNYRRVAHGYVNDNFIVKTTSGRYFLKRRHPDLSKPHLVTAQHVLIQHLHSVLFPTPTIVPTQHGMTFVKDRTRIYEIHGYLSGNLCDATRPAHFAAAARTLGQYHAAVWQFDSEAFHRPHERYGPDALAWTIVRIRRNWGDETPPELEVLIGELREHARDLQVRFRECKRLPEVVIHGDYYADNLIFQGDEIAGVVDYDLAHWSPRAMEVAEVLIFFAAQRPGHLKHIVYSDVLDLDAVHRFLAAYNEIAHLSDRETHALPHLIRTIWLCASLDPPLKPLLELAAAPQALPEVLTLADWAQAHASDIVEIGLAARSQPA